MWTDAMFKNVFAQGCTTGGSTSILCFCGTPRLCAPRPIDAPGKSLTLPTPSLDSEHNERQERRALRGPSRLEAVRTDLAKRHHALACRTIWPCRGAAHAGGARHGHVASGKTRDAGQGLHAHPNSLDRKRDVRHTTGAPPRGNPAPDHGFDEFGEPVGEQGGGWARTMAQLW